MVVHDFIFAILIPTNRTLFLGVDDSLADIARHFNARVVLIFAILHAAWPCVVRCILPLPMMMTELFSV